MRTLYRVLAAAGAVSYVVACARLACALGMLAGQVFVPPPAPIPACMVTCVPDDAAGDGADIGVDVES